MKILLIFFLVKPVGSLKRKKRVLKKIVISVFLIWFLENTSSHALENKTFDLKQHHRMIDVVYTYDLIYFS